MRELAGGVALVTGASGGLGRHIARALARERMHVVLSGRREDALTELAHDLVARGVRAAAVPADLADLTAIGDLVDRAEQELGPIDVLVSNAGVEINASFTQMTALELTSMIEVNLTAPLLLTQRVVPGMLARGRGHVVLVASAAGKVGPPYSEPYAASKAGLIALARSLRAEYAEAPIGFSVICPGFIAGDGMWERLREGGARSNRMIGETTVEKVTAKVVDAIRRDLPEVLETGAPIRPLLALNELSPRLGHRIARLVGVPALFRRLAAQRGRLDTVR